jgi:hypothetical protein
MVLFGVNRKGVWVGDAEYVATGLGYPNTLNCMVSDGDNQCGSQTVCNENTVVSLCPSEEKKITITPDWVYVSENIGQTDQWPGGKTPIAVLVIRSDGSVEYLIGSSKQYPVYYQDMNRNVTTYTTTRMVGKNRHKRKNDTMIIVGVVTALVVILLVCVFYVKYLKGHKLKRKRKKL